MLDFIFKILQSSKYQIGSIFFHLKIAQLYIITCIFMLSRLFSNHLKIIKIKDRTLC